MTKKLAEQVKEDLDVREPVKIGGLKTKRPNKRKDTPSTEDPVEELRRLVIEHKSLTKRACSIEGMARDKVRRDRNGEPVLDENGKPQIISCHIAKDEQDAMCDVVKALRAAASKKEPSITKALRRIPIFTMFLDGVFGFGPIVSAYIVSEIDITKCVKPSQLKRYCGMAVMNGHLERKARQQLWLRADACKSRKPYPLKRPAADEDRKVVDGVELWNVSAPSGYNAELRTRLYQAFSAMWKNAAKTTAEAPNGTTTKYLTIWTDYKHRMQHSARYDAKANTLAPFDGVGPVRKGAKAAIHATGWHKAADVFLEDLYMVWRSIEGLDVWPNYYAAKLGVTHRGADVCSGEPRKLTAEQALDLVGDVGSVPVATDQAAE
ncbi:MAG: hypothetical protein WC911_10900 [Thermoleophilia bacterium]